MSYPVAGNVKQLLRARISRPITRSCRTAFSVILNAPAVFRFTAAASPERHLQAAEALGADVSRAQAGGRGARPRRPHHLVHAAAQGARNLRAVGYTSADIPALVEGTLAQERVTKLSPRAADAETLARSSKTRCRAGPLIGVLEV